jgi:uncharacterized protein with FMN-binding domain
MQTKNYLAILAVVVVVLAGSAYAMSGDKNQEAAIAQVSTTPTQGETPVAPTTPSTDAVVKKYTDGTYTAPGEYKAPSGKESIHVSVTLKDGVIVDTTVTGEGENPATKANQEKFISGYKSLVVGKNLDEANLTIVSGSSLTGAGWNSALEIIKTLAKA